MNAQPDLRDLLEMDPEQAIRRYREDYERLAEEYRRKGKDEVADVIESTLRSVQEGSA